MGDATTGDVLPYCTCIMGALVLLGIRAWLAIHKLWKSELRGAYFSSIYQTARTILWLLSIAAWSLYSVFVLWLFGYWIQLLIELFKDKS